MNINVAQAYWFFAGKIVIEQISTKSVKSGCPHFPTIKVEMFWDVCDSPKIQLLSMPFRPGAEKISAVPWRTACPSVAQGGRSCKSPKAAWCSLKDQLRWALLCLQPTEESYVFFHSLRCLSISCHVVMSSWKLTLPSLSPTGNNSACPAKEQLGVPNLKAKAPGMLKGCDARVHLLGSRVIKLLVADSVMLMKAGMLWTECENEKDDEDDENAEDAEEDKDDEDDEDEDEEDADDNVDHHYYHNPLSRWNVFRPTIPLPKMNPCTRHGISNHWTLKSRALHQARLCSVQPNLPNFWNQFTNAAWANQKL